MAVDRRTVDLSAFPDLVVVYLGMRVNAFTGIKTLLGMGPQIERSHKAMPDGLLLHENMVYSLFPPHVGMRQYWRDFAALEAWTRSDPHRTWWKNYLRSSGGTGFWHETYRITGGIEAIYDDLGAPVGMMKFAPTVDARGGMFSARRRLTAAGATDVSAAEAEAVVPEAELRAN
jgi:fumigallin biosynthesis monooxygenase-like protein